MKSRAFLLATTAALLMGGFSLYSPTIARADQTEAGDIVRHADDLPAPIVSRSPARIKVALETIEKWGRLSDGTSYRYWTFDGRVPGPMLRVRVGDTVDVTLRNHPDSWMNHNVDFHAVTGPGGGGIATVAEPSQTKGFSFKALNPGLYVYHCAVPMAAQH